MAASGGHWKSGSFVTAGGAVDPITGSKVSDLSDRRLVQRYKSARESVNITRGVLAKTEREAKNSGPEYAERILGIARTNFSEAERVFNALKAEADKRLAKRR